MTVQANFKLELRERVPQAVAQIREEDAWVDIPLPLTETVRLLQAEVRETEGRLAVLARAIESISVALPGSGLATAQTSLFGNVAELDKEVTSNAAAIVSLTSEVATKAAASALQALTTRVTTSEGGISTNASAITALQTSVATKAAASALTALATRVTTNESGISANAASITALQVEVATKAAASALTALDARVTTAEGTIASNASSINSLTAQIATRAAATALDNLAARVTQTETGIEVNARDVTFVQALLDGVALGGAPNTFLAETRADAVALRNAQATGDAAWLKTYNDNQTLHVHLVWDDDHIYQRRGSGAWVDVRADGRASASALQTLEARVGTNETGLAGLARWQVKTTVGGLTGAIGLINDGTDTKLYIQADKFVLMPTAAPADLDADTVSPFFVSGGVVYIREAAIQNLSIGGGKLKLGTLEADRLVIGAIRDQYLEANLMAGAITFTHNGDSYTLQCAGDRPEILVDVASGSTVVDFAGAVIYLTLLLNGSPIRFTHADFSTTVTYPSGVTGQFVEATGQMALTVIPDNTVDGNITLAVTHTPSSEVANFTVPFRKRARAQRPWSFWTVTTTETAWSDTVANGAIPGGPIDGDILTMSGDGFEETRRYIDAVWVPVSAIINGDLLVNGAIGARHLSVDTIEAQHITARSIESGKIQVSGIAKENMQFASVDRLELKDNAVEFRHLHSTVRELIGAQAYAGEWSRTLTASDNEMILTEVNVPIATKADSVATVEYDSITLSVSAPITFSSRTTRSGHRTATQTTTRPGGARGDSPGMTVTTQGFRNWKYVLETWVTPAYTATVTLKLKITGQTDVVKTLTLNIPVTSIIIRGPTRTGAFDRNRVNNAPTPSNPVVPAGSTRTVTATVEAGMFTGLLGVNTDPGDDGIDVQVTGQVTGTNPIALRVSLVVDV